MVTQKCNKDITERAITQVALLSSQLIQSLSHMTQLAIDQALENQAKQIFLEIENYYQEFGTLNIKRFKRKYGAKE